MDNDVQPVGNILILVHLEMPNLQVYLNLFFTLSEHHTVYE